MAPKKARLMILVRGRVWVLWGGLFVSTAVGVGQEISGHPESEGAAPGKPTSTATQGSVAYGVDSALREAWRQYVDAKGRNREAVRSLFEAYLAKEPNSPFQAEVYYLMGSLYSNNVIAELGEKMDLPLAKKYYGKAHELYGSKLTPQAEGAYWLLVSAPGTFADRKAFYEWLTKLAKAGTPEDMYPIRTIDQCILHQAPPEDDLAGRIARLKWLQNRYIQDRITSTEQEMLRYASWGDDRYQKLLDLATTYPGTELAKQARHVLDEMNNHVPGNSVNEVLADIRNTLPSPAVGQKPTPSDVTPSDNGVGNISGPNAPRASLPSGGVLAAQGTSGSSLHRINRVWLVVLTCLLAATVGGVLLTRRPGR
jgi:hypothetical protein